MKTTTKILSILGLAMAAWLPVSNAADDTTAPVEHEHPRMKRMEQNRLDQLDQKLHLTAEQKTQIQAIWDKTGQDVRALRQDQNLSQEDRKAKRREAMKAAHDQVRALLTADQQKIFDTMPMRGNRAWRTPSGDESKSQ